MTYRKSQLDPPTEIRNGETLTFDAADAEWKPAGSGLEIVGYVISAERPGILGGLARKLGLSYGWMIVKAGLMEYAPKKASDE